VWKWYKVYRGAARYLGPYLQLWPKIQPAPLNLYVCNMVGQVTWSTPRLPQPYGTTFSCQCFNYPDHTCAAVRWEYSAFVTGSQGRRFITVILDQTFTK
jgi:hypothetical protein